MTLVLLFSLICINVTSQRLNNKVSKQYVIHESKCKEVIKKRRHSRLQQPNNTKQSDSIISDKGKQLIIEESHRTLNPKIF